MGRNNARQQQALEQHSLQAARHLSFEAMPGIRRAINELRKIADLRIDDAAEQRLLDLHHVLGQLDTGVIALVGPDEAARLKSAQPEKGGRS